MRLNEIKKESSLLLLVNVFRFGRIGLFTCPWFLGLAECQLGRLLSIYERMGNLVVIV